MSEQSTLESMPGSHPRFTVHDDIRWLLDVGFFHSAHFDSCPASAGGTCECRLGMIRARYEHPTRFTPLLEEPDAPIR